MTLSPGDEYVALGSSFAAGPGLRPRASQAPRASGRSSVNYAHLIAQELGLKLKDATFSGATSVDLMSTRLGGEPPQIQAVTATSKLVTITGGGNDVLFIQGLFAASLPRWARLIPGTPERLHSFLDPSQTDKRLDDARSSLRILARAARTRAPDARVIFVDYLTVVPPDATSETKGLPAVYAAAARNLAARLAEITRIAATDEGCEVAAASSASLDHHAWSAEPWTRRFGLSLRGGAPYHPTYAGMRAVADLVVRQLGTAPSASGQG